MSGGYFDYNQYHMRTIADTIQSELEKWDWDGGTFDFTVRTAQTFQDAIALLRVAEVYAQRIDWFLSGDDTEEGFHALLREDLERASYYTQLIPWIEFPKPEKDDERG